MKRLIALLGVAVLTSCSGGNKKVIVLAKGSLKIDQKAKTIQVTPGTGQEEQRLHYTDAGNLDLQLSSPAGNITITIPTDGLYILNAKPDTIVGGYVNYGAPELTQRIITQDELKIKIDSLILLTQGLNVNEANRNYFILPNTAVKITGNVDATIITPFHRMTALDVKKGEKPEVYRFYNLSEIRETLNRLQGMTGEGSKP